MPFKDPEKRRQYQREYKRRQRARERGKLSISCQTQAPELQIPQSLNWTKPYEPRADYYLQGEWLFDTYTGRPVKRYEGPA